jgi:hypothetical protein
MGDCCARVDQYVLRLKVEAALSSMTMVTLRHTGSQNSAKGCVAK